VAAALALARESRVFSPRTLGVAGLALAVVVAGVGAPWASNRPDGLERVALDLNFANLAAGNPALAPGYEAPGIVWPTLAVAIAGIGGALAVYVANYALARTAKARVRKY
jgi:hypothetical protein